MQELWGESDALHFFTYTCPKLFELKALAYWPLVQEAHSRAFLATISYLTQIVFNLGFHEEHTCAVRILKTERQPSRVLHVAHYFTVQDESITFVTLPGDTDARKEATVLKTNRTALMAGSSERESSRIGTRIRDYRAEKRLSQADLARILNITPSALSQIEHNHTLPSLTLFVEIARFFGKSLDSLVAPEPGPVRVPRTRE
jgi:DNA-binding XRE family transcriptional regulator